jgi:hypothetical protein
MKKLAASCLLSAVALSTIGGTPAHADQTAGTCNNPMGAIHYFDIWSAPTKGAKGSTYRTMGQAKYSSAGRGCESAARHILLRYAPVGSTSGYRSLKPNLIDSGNGKFSLSILLNQSFKYYLEWDYGTNAAATTKRHIVTVSVT